MGLMQYTKLFYAPSSEVQRKGRQHVVVMSGKFEGRKGWIDEIDISSEFPASDNFEIPHISTKVPRLYHGSDRDSIQQIMIDGFRIGKVSAGRTYGDGIYGTPYVSKAAQHGANKVLMEDKNEFAVGLMKPKRDILPDEIMIHNIYIEEELLNKGKTMEEAIKLQHGTEFLSEVQKLRSDKLAPLSHIDITAAAKSKKKQIIIYVGEGGHIVYVFTQADTPMIEKIFLEGTNPITTGGWEMLDWYHEAQFKDKIQGEMNKL